MLAVPLARGDETFGQVGARAGAVALVALVAALVLGWSSLIPASVAIAGGLYAAELAISDSRVDVAAPAIAAGLFLCAELGYWSLDERHRWSADPGDGLRRTAFVALLGVAAFVVAAVLLALVDAVRARGLAFDLVGAAAAAAAVAALLAAARVSPRQSSDGS
ncbi:MAG TPA: hypothetical protein VFU99_10010 [Gaiellaceae bacterium]|nr:hypothetical protein [Gaiellaceae bacterium]